MTALKKLMSDPALFARAGGVTLRPYQEQIIRAITDSVLNGKGTIFTIAISRQGGKNEAQAQLEAYLLTLLQFTDASIVVASPTYKPQTENAMRRLQRVLKANPMTRNKFRRESGYIFRVGSARALFFSADPEAHVVGATASTLLIVDETQDVPILKYDREFVPMTASTNATIALFGTVWTRQTLLARETTAALAAQTADGQRRIFHIPAPEVALHVPAYAAHLAREVARLGRQHPAIRSQYYLEPVDEQTGLFPARRLALMIGQHQRHEHPVNEALYAFLVDVGGADEQPTTPGQPATGRHNQTTLTIVQADLTTLADPTINAPTYNVAHRFWWEGANQPDLYAAISALAEQWQPRHIVIDATGLGAGLAAFLARRHQQTIPFLFTAQTKSALAYNFISIIETGRWRDYHPPDTEQITFFNQMTFCEATILPGPTHLVRWGVPDGTTDPTTGKQVLDDWITSAALASILDEQTWQITAAPLTVHAPDPLEAYNRRLR